MFKAYSDESGINVGDRYTSVSVVSGEAEVLNCLRDKLGKTLRDKNVDEVKFSEIKRYGSSVAKAAINFIECTVNDFAIYNRVRVDTITTDNACLAGDNYDSGNKPELERMYYCVLANIVRRWRYTKWGFSPDMNSGINWSEIVSFLNMSRLQKRVKKPLLIELMLSEDVQFQFSEVEQLNSAEEPLVQLADLFAGMARFSHEDNVNCAEWVERWRDVKQGELIPYMARNNGNITRSKECRYRLIGGLYFLCRRHGLYVSIRSENHLKTWRPQNPINFWDYRRTY